MALLVVSAAAIFPAASTARAGEVTAGATQAANPIYFDATISMAGEAITRPFALVREGSTAQFNLGNKRAPAPGPRLGLRYVVPAASETNASVTVSGLVDGREVVSGPLDVTGADGAVVVLDGGGYTWRVHASRVLPQLCQRKRDTRP